MRDKKVIEKVFDDKFNSEKVKESVMLKYERQKIKKRYRLALIPVLLFIITISVFGYSNFSYFSKKDVSLDDKSSNKIDSVKKDKYTKIIHKKYSEQVNEDSLINWRDPAKLTENLPYIAIVRIDSIDGSTRRNRKTNDIVLNVYSYGKATVLKTFKGDLPEKIEYRIMGGTIPYREWVDADIDPDKLWAYIEKNDYKIDGVDIDEVAFKQDGPIGEEFQVGKTYLVYMNHSSSNYDNEYIISGYQYGIHEVKEPSKFSYSNDDINLLEIKNNDTGKWENISTLLKYINKNDR